MEHEMGLRPHMLGMMALCQAFSNLIALLWASELVTLVWQGVAFAVTGPLWGNLVDSGASRKLVLRVP